MNSIKAPKIDPFWVGLIGGFGLIAYRDLIGEHNYLITLAEIAAGSVFWIGCSLRNIATQLRPISPGRSDD